MTRREAKRHKKFERPKDKHARRKWILGTLAGLVLFGVYGGFLIESETANKIEAQSDELRGLIAQLAETAAGLCDPARAGGELASLMETGMVRQVESVGDNAWKWNKQDWLGLAHAVQKGYRVCLDNRLTGYGAVYYPAQRLLSVSSAIEADTATVAMRKGLYELHKRDWEHGSLGKADRNQGTGFAMSRNIEDTWGEVLEVTGPVPSPPVKPGAGS